MSGKSWDIIFHSPIVKDRMLIYDSNHKKENKRRRRRQQGGNTVRESGQGEHPKGSPTGNESGTK